jgi:DNA-binding beta-propeller fold protein YncE
MFARLLRQSAILCAIAATSLSAQSYHVAHTYTLGGDGGWDYITLDTLTHRLFIGRSNRIMVVDPDSGVVLGEIPGLTRAHGVALAGTTGHGFATSGGDSSVVMFDTRTLQVLGRTIAAPDADAILYDPVTTHIFTFNGDAHSASVLDAVSGRRLGTIDLGAAPEFAVSAGDGSLYVNLEDTGELAQLDGAAMRVTRRWSLAPCESPTGLAIDRAHHRLFSGCRNQLLAISDATAGRLIGTVPIGQGVDACRFDAETQLVFASNGEGTMSVIRELTPDSFPVLAMVPTKRGARTMELEPHSHRLFTVTADFGPAPAPTTEQPRPRPSVVPGTFALLVLEP